MPDAILEMRKWRLDKQEKMVSVVGTPVDLGT